MLYELPITQEVFNKIKAIETKGTGYVFFKLANKHEDTLFALVHGNKEGLVDVGKLVTLQELLGYLMAKGLKAKGIKEVITISCHGGAQQEAKIDGVTISSMHDSLEEIHTKAYSTLDDEYFLTVSVNESLEGGITMSNTENYKLVQPESNEDYTYLYNGGDDVMLETKIPCGTVEAEIYYTEMYGKDTKAVLRSHLEQLGAVYSETRFKKVKREALLHLLVMANVTATWSSDMKRAFLSDETYDELVEVGLIKADVVGMDASAASVNPLPAEQPVVEQPTEQPVVASVSEHKPYSKGLDFDSIKLAWEAYYAARRRGENPADPNGKVHPLKVSEVSHGGSYTESEMAKMKADALAAGHASSGESCICCSGAVSKNNLMYLKGSKVRARIMEVNASLVDKPLCWTCQQLVLDGKAPLTVAGRIAGDHKRVSKSTWHASRA